MRTELTFIDSDTVEQVVFADGDEKGEIHRLRDSYELHNSTIIFEKIFGGGSIHFRREGYEITFTENDVVFARMKRK